MTATGELAARRSVAEAPAVLAFSPLPPLRLPGVDQRVVTGDRRRRDGRTVDGATGDCLRACLATLLALPYADVPHLGDHGPSWWDALRRWGRGRRGIDFASIGVRDGSLRDVLAGDLDGLHVIGVGTSPRGPYTHSAVVDVDLRIVWDPHPSRAGVRGGVDSVIAVVRPYDFDPIRTMPELTAGP